MTESQPRPTLTPTFFLIGALFVCALMISNIICGKLFSLWGMVLTADLILFPLTYIFGDVLTEVYGFKRARLVIWTGFLCNLLMALAFMAALALPHPGFWKGQAAFATVLGSTPRIVMASLAAYFVGELSNSIVLSRMKVATGGRWLWARTIGSTLVGEGFDTMVFMTIAFIGTMAPNILMQMIVFQYLWKVSYEVLATPLTYKLINWLKEKEQIDTYDHDISYNPFSFNA
ncbi:MAG: queuosine precursor transporter [Methanomassiliicoccales archaeon]